MKPPAVNFVFRYGVGAINELNTPNQTYTKDKKEYKALPTPKGGYK